MLNKKLKKLSVGVLFLAMSLNVIACGSTATERTSNVQKVMESQIAAENKSVNPNTKRQVANGSQLIGNGSNLQAPASTKNVQLDLTSLSSTVADAQLQKLQSNRDFYRGLVMKIKGDFNYTYVKETDKTYYNCIFSSTCCPNGLEFVLADSSKYPTEQWSPITVVGEFNYYEEDGQIYYTLTNAQIV